MEKTIFLIIIILFALGTFIFANTNPIAIFDASDLEKSSIKSTDAPDGKFETTTFDGKPALKNLGFRNNLYFKVDPEIKKTLSSDLWILVYGGSDAFSGVTTRYNSEKDPYETAEEVRTLGGMEPDKFLIHLPNANFRGAQNGDADFRLQLYTLFVNKIELYNQKPDLDIQSNAERMKIIMEKISNLPDLSVSKVSPVEYVVCGDDHFGKYFRDIRQKTPWFGTSFDPESVRILKKLGVTSVQCYVPWESCETNKMGEWDFSGWDKEVQVLKNENLKFSPFLILGPSYATPEWFRQSKDFMPGKCLEHGIENKVDHVWNPHMSKYIDRFLAEFGKKYNKDNFLEVVLLGIQGDYGEAIYPNLPGLAGIEPGEYHGHEGFWCNVPEALIDYKSFLKNKYKNITNLNKVWNKNYSSFEVINFPAKGEEITNLRANIKNENGFKKREYLDFITWYRESMNNLAEVWFESAVKYFPNIPIYLCTGGGGESVHGSDFSLNSKTAGKYKGGIRITNEGSVYIWNNLSTRLLTSSARFYGAKTGKEPFGDITPEGMVARMYGTISSGSSQHEDYYRNVTDHAKKYEYSKEYASFLEYYPDIVSPVSIYYPNVAVTLGEAPWWPDYEKIRYMVNCEYIDENMLRDGALKTTEIMIMPSTVIEPKDAETIAQWAKEGHLVIVMNKEPMKTVEGGNESEMILFPESPDGTQMGNGAIIRITDFNKIRETLTSQLLTRKYPVYASEKEDYFGAQVSEDTLIFYNPKDIDVEASYIHPDDGKILKINIPAFGMAKTKL